MACIGKRSNKKSSDKFIVTRGSRFTVSPVIFGKNFRKGGWGHGSLGNDVGALIRGDLVFEEPLT